MQTNSPGTLKDKFGNFGAAPTDRLWNSIESSLDQNKTKKRGAFWWWFAGIAAASLLLIGIYQWGYQVGKNETDRTAFNSVINPSFAEKNTVENDSIEINSTANTTHGIDLSTIDIRQESTNNPASNSNSDNTSTKNYRSDTDMNLQKNNDHTFEKNSDLYSFQPFFMEEMKHEKIQPLKKPLIQKIVLENKNSFLLPNPIEVEQPASCRHWELAFEVGTLKTNSSGDQALPAFNSLTLDESAENYFVDNTMLASIPENPNLGGIARPFHLMLSANYHFHCRFAFEFGLGYSQIRSQVSYEMLPISFYVNSTYHSLAVPTKFSYDFMKKKRADLSVRGGFIHEFPIIEKNETNLLSSFNTPAKSTITGYNAAAEMNLDFKLKLGNRAQVQFSPTFRYYLMQRINSSQPILERNAWYGIQAGFRWRL